jgi:hypothetical protein
MSLRNIVFMFRHKRACRRLQRIVEERRQSFEAEQYRRRRAAALKHTRPQGAG